MGLFNTYATLVADVNLLLQLTILLVLILGWRFERGGDYLKHGIMMGTALAFHTLLIFLVMVPSLRVSTGLFANLLNRLTLVVLSHSTLGSLVEVLGIYLFSVWLSDRGVSKACFRNKGIMKATVILWAIEIVLGIYLYILLYSPV
jgi:uncharacterized membrane protein YozB (DUF420 family)